MGTQTRRDFLRTTTAGGLALWATGEAWAQDKSANDTINWACVGIKGKGESDTADAARFGNIVAICDIDDNFLADAAKKYPNAKVYNDFRKMYDEMGKSIDAVTVSTPDHTHAPAAARALRMGKHVYCQKPLTHDIYEARTLGRLARENKVQTQMGNQGTANAGVRKAAKQIQAGILGQVKEVHVWTNRPIWPQGIARPAAETPPSHVHWDLFLGPAKERPYGKGYHSFAWRGWWDFGTGALGDMACHTMNMPFMALNLRNPVSVMAEAGENNRDSYPLWSVVRYEFAGTKERGPLTLYWYDGKSPKKDAIAEMLNGNKMSGSGSLMIGEKGSLYSPDDYGAEYKLFGGAQEVEVEYERSPGHFAELVRAIKEGKPAVSNFPDYASPLTETVLLGNLAVWSAGKKIEWDARRLRAKNAPEVAHIIKGEYRKGWEL